MRVKPYSQYSQDKTEYMNIIYVCVCLISTHRHKYALREKLLSKLYFIGY